MYSFVDQNNSAFLVHVICVAHVFYQEIYVVPLNSPHSVLADVFGVITSKQFLFNLCDPSRLKWFSTEQNETIN